MKGVILAGGTGSRLHPLTRITNKHLLPIYDRPMVTYAIDALVSGGVSEILLVTGGTHAGEFFRLLGDGHGHGIGLLQYAYQEREAGIADALGLAERFAGDDRVLVMLADNIFERSIKPAIDNFGKQERGARIVLSKVEQPEHLRHLGVAELDGDKVVRIVEKPERPPSEFAVTGLYFYDPTVFEFLPSLSPSARGELEITDVNNAYVAAKRARLELLPRGLAWLDTGTQESLLDASHFVATLSRRQGTSIACLEEIAYRMGFIDAAGLRRLAQKCGKSQYGQYMLRALDET